MPFKSTYNILFLTIIVFFIQAGCGTVKPYYGKAYKSWPDNNMPADEVLHSIYLIGDGGDVLIDEPDNVLAALEKKIKAEPDSTSSIIFLGDNIYERGLPEESSPVREKKEEIIEAQMNITKGYKGRVIFIPGNHDWDKSGPVGLEAINREEEYIEEYLKNTKSNVFLPDNGCPGPVEVNVNDQLTIIIVDTEWWLRKYDKPHAPENGCQVEDQLDFIIQLEDIVKKNDGKHVLLAAHHPLFSNGNHGGHYNFWDNIFPLRLVRDHLYIPLPVIGSLYPVLRKSGASAQDIPNTDYQRYKKALISILENRPNVVYAAGHDHNLQMHKQGLMHEVISGAASKSNFAARGFGAEYVHQTSGFSRIRYYKSGEAWVEFFSVTEANHDGEVSFRTPLYALNPEQTPAADIDHVPDYGDSTKMMAANPNYSMSKLGEFFFGAHYRNEWVTPIKVPYIDLKTYAGGLKPIKKGGGKQTISIRFMNTDSVQYNLRSIDKFPAGAIPAVFRDTWVNDFVKDQISTAHPYGALTIPAMASAVGINHTNPKIFYTPHTPTLGPYIGDFGGRMGLMEIRPDEDLSAYERFGNSTNVVSTETMFEHLKKDNDNEVDAKMYLKSRLFDMLIGDWDRHEDQWRWAEYEKETKGSVFRPVPRDRDQVFVLYDGVIPWILSRKWAFRNFNSFDYTIKDVAGLNFSARNIDHALLSELSKDDWKKIAQDVQQKLTDQVIDKAIHELPKEVYPISGKEIAAKLKSRRDHLLEYAFEYYTYLSKDVSIVASDKHELIKIDRMSDDETWVRVYKTTEDKEVKQKLYDRVFSNDETDEIWIFGRDGNDQFEIEGEVNKGLKLRIVGGEDSDTFTDKSHVAEWGHQAIFYDNNEDVPRMYAGTDARIKTSKKEWVNRYDRDMYKYNYLGPRLFFEYNVDDGIYLGGGAKFTTQGFRHDPAKTSHTVLANYAINTQAFNFKYRGDFYSLFGHHWDLQLDALANGPKYVLNYFGQGNETDYNENIDYYRVKMNSVKVNPSIVKRLSKVVKIGLGPDYEFIDVQENNNTILDAEVAQDDYLKTSSTKFAGARFFTSIALTDHPVNPEKGVIWKNEIHYLKELTSNGVDFTRYKSDLSVYFSPNLPLRLTVASRVGVATNVGDYYFYHSNFLGNLENLRGFRKFRFAGKTSFYNNNEVRLKVFNLRNNLVNGNVGVFGFYDQGRVWTKEGNSSKMHHAYGPGVYLHLFEVFLLSGSYGISEEENLFTIKTGFLF